MMGNGGQTQKQHVPFFSLCGGCILTAIGHRGCRVRLLTLLLPVGAAAGELGHITLIGEKIHFGSQFGRLKPVVGQPHCCGPW